MMKGKAITLLLTLTICLTQPVLAAPDVGVTGWAESLLVGLVESFWSGDQAPGEAAAEREGTLDRSPAELISPASLSSNFEMPSVDEAAGDESQTQTPEFSPEWIPVG